MAQLKRPKYSRSKSIEKKEIAILQGLFNDADILTDLTRGDDDFPTIDGYLHLLNKKRETIGQMLQVQVKPIRYKKGGQPVSTCKMELLVHSYESSTPVLVLGVDIDKGLAYWVYLSPESMKDTLNSDGGKKTTQVNFPKKNVIKKGGPDYVDEWRRICLHHRNESNDKIMARLVRKRKKEDATKQISATSLETLKDIVFYRTNGGNYPFFDYALSLAGAVRKHDESAKLRYIEILEHIYYYRAADVLKNLFDFTLDESSKVADKARKILLEVAKYNFHILNTLGYGPHGLLMDTLPDFMARGGKNIRLLATEILRNVLSSSFEGTSNTDHITITFHCGPLEPTPYLQKIRHNAIDLLFRLFAEAEDTKEKVEILSTIFHGFHAPDYPFADDEANRRYFSMVNREATQIIRRYRKIAFTSPKVLSEEYPVVYEMEHQMAWLTVWKRDVEGLQSFLDSLRTTKSDYDFYRTIVGEAHDISPDEEFGAAKENKEDSIQHYLDLITIENSEERLARLAKVATFKGVVDDWKFNRFNDFLARIGKYKPEIADRMLASIFDKQGALYPFAGNFLFGLRQSSISLWDKYARHIESDKSKDLTKAILTSFEFHPTLEVTAKIRPEDIELLTKIVRFEDGFVFLKGKADKLFLYQCIRAALYVYQANPKQCRSLVVELLKSHPEETPLFLDQFSFALWDGVKWLTLDDWEKSELGALAAALVEVQRFDHNEEQILLKLGQRDFDVMISVLDGRLERETREKSDFSVDPPRFSHYDAIPHHFSNQELGKFIREHQKYEAVLTRWIDGIAEKYTSGTIDLSKFIRFIDGPVLEEAIQNLIASGTKENIKKVLALFPLTEAPDFRICFKIIEATDDKEILNNVGGKMRNVGVMSGGYGDDLYGNGLRSVKQRLEREGLTHPSQKVKDFSAKMIKGLENDIAASAEQNKKRIDEEKQEFEETKLD